MLQYFTKKACNIFNIWYYEYIKHVKRFTEEGRLLEIATLKDIAKHAGVSVCTVSRYLNKDLVIKKETEERIRQAIEELNYMPNGVAKSLKRNKTTNIAVILPKIDNLYYSSMTAGIGEVLGQEGYNLFIYEMNYLNHDEKAILQLMRENMAVGVIFVGLSTDLSFHDHIHTLLEWGIPVVYMNRQIPYEGYPLIYPDFAGTGKIVAKHLEQKGKYRTAFVYKDKNKQFIQGLVDSFMDAKTEAEEPYRIDMGMGVSVEACIDRLIELKIDSIFAVSEMLTLKLTKGLVMRGIRIPKDIAAVSFGNSLISEIATPELTCLDFGDKEMGRCSAELILKQIRGEQVNPVTEFPVRLIQREST